MKLSPLTATSRYVIGKLSMKTRKIRIVNVLTQQEDLLVVCSGACDARVGARLLMGALDPCSHTGRARCRGNAQRDPGPLHREQRARKVVHMETPGRGCVTSHEDERRRAVRKRVRARNLNNKLPCSYKRVCARNLDTSKNCANTIKSDLLVL